MDRFSIMLGRKSYVPEFIKISGSIPEITNKVVIQEKWHNTTQSISLERSPRKAWCHTCTKFIDPKVFRFSVVTFHDPLRGRQRFSVKHSYHLNCLPEKEKQCVKKSKVEKEKIRK